MNVKELIEKLGEFDPELVVWQSGGGDPYCAGEISMVEVIEIPDGRELMGHINTPRTYLELG